VKAFLDKKEKLMLTNSQVKKLSLAEQLQYSAQLLKPVQKENLASVSKKVMEQQQKGQTSQQTMTLLAAQLHKAINHKRAA